MSEVSVLDALKVELDRREIEEDREELTQSLHAFIRKAFPQVKKNRPFVSGWHIEAICAHLEAVSARQIERLQIWIPPGCMKRMGVHVFWPAGFGGVIDWMSALIALAAGIALFAFRQGVVPVIVGCGVLGLAARWLTSY